MNSLVKALVFADLDSHEFAGISTAVLQDVIRELVTELTDIDDELDDHKALDKRLYEERRQPSNRVVRISKIAATRDMAMKTSKRRGGIIEQATLMAEAVDPGHPIEMAQVPLIKNVAALVCKLEEAEDNGL